MILITIYWGGANEKSGNGAKAESIDFSILNIGVCYTCCLDGWACCASMQQAYAQTAGVKSYNIPAGRLANVLNQFAEQSGTSIAMDAQQLQGLHSLA